MGSGTKENNQGEKTELERSHPLTLGGGREKQIMFRWETAPYCSGSEVDPRLSTQQLRCKTHKP